MNRRELIQSLGLASTHILFPSILVGFVSSCQDTAQTEDGYIPVFFKQKELEVIKEVIDIMLPATKSRSASEVNTHRFLDEVFAKCMNADQQSLIREGLQKLVPQFMAAKNKQDLIAEIDQKAYSGDEASGYFRAIKQYAMVGFFTSQEGMTVASNFVKFPGDYKGEIPCDDNTLNYGKTNLRYYL
jgi:hypothetical protein